MREGNILPLIRQREFSAWGIQTGAFAALPAKFDLKAFQLSDFHTGVQIIIGPERGRPQALNPLCLINGWIFPL